MAEVVLVLRGTTKGTEEPEQCRARVIDALDVDDNPKLHCGDQCGVLNESVHVRHRESQGLLHAGSVGGNLWQATHLRTGLFVAEHELANRGVSGHLQLCIALVARGKLVGERKLDPKFGILLLEPCTVRCIFRVTCGAGRRRCARTTSSMGRADLGRHGRGGWGSRHGPSGIRWETGRRSSL